MPRTLDIWRCAIVRQSADAILRDGIDEAAVRWLPEMSPFSFRADPFGFWRDDRLTIFAEAFDYRTRIGHIDALVYDKDLRLLECRTALKTPWHLSYPFVFEADGDVWMLPEAYRSGTLRLYRARAFPFDWEPVCEIPLDGPAIDATPLFHDGKWWLLYAPSADKSARTSHLHVAWAEKLTGPWHLHPLNPVRISLSGSRPGGTPLRTGQGIVLPVQDCRRTYGGAIRQLVIRTLDTTHFEAEERDGLSAPTWMAPATDGLHTLASAGPVTLIDVKELHASLLGNVIGLRGIIRRFLRGKGIML